MRDYFLSDSNVILNFYLLQTPSSPPMTTKNPLSSNIKAKTEAKKQSTVSNDAQPCSSNDSDLTKEERKCLQTLEWVVRLMNQVRFLYIIIF